eukprot:TRINITY_DN48219_c0_g1_i1.p1 TRINITY_DN48219_c0_g1~~TRINITY_DN48219_c0_g1_i1.p1  ORF type:complete len:241 (+),score=43.12 TRINITY_DN48219_c0_g1_i1:89-811(+)
MGQICGPICDEQAYNGGMPRGQGTKIEQLDQELRWLRDDNYRIREEQLRLERELNQHAALRDGGLGCGPGSPPQPRGGQRQARGQHAPGMRSGGVGFEDSSQAARVDMEQQLTYMHELIRSIRSENDKLKQVIRADANVGPGSGSVEERKYIQLQEKMAQLQHAHHRQMQQLRSLQSNTASPKLPGRSSFPALSQQQQYQQHQFYGQQQLPGSGDLQAELQKLSQENEALRGKVRKLARN